MRFLN